MNNRAEENNDSSGVTSTIYAWFSRLWSEVTNWLISLFMRGTKPQESGLAQDNEWQRESYGDDKNWQWLREFRDKRKACQAEIDHDLQQIKHGISGLNGSISALRPEVNQVKEEMRQLQHLLLSNITVPQRLLRHSSVFSSARRSGGERNSKSFARR